MDTLGEATKIYGERRFRLTGMSGSIAKMM
jgi:hypothetical protein